jgi:hypothetical protein
MPAVIGTPEQWFRTQGCDFFEISPIDDSEENFIFGDIPDRRRVEILAEAEEWFKQHLPHRSITILGPSEYSGFICGGPRMRVVALDENDLKLFGKFDARWVCYQWRYQDWLDRFDNIQTTPGIPPAGTSCRWFLCKAGLFWIKDGDYPGEPRFDDWWLIRRRYPDLLIKKNEVFLMGNIFFDSPNKPPSVVFERYKEEHGDIHYAFTSLGEKLLKKYTKHIRTALALPKGTKIGYEFF